MRFSCAVSLKKRPPVGGPFEFRRAAWQSCPGGWRSHLAVLGDRLWLRLDDPQRLDPVPNFGLCFGRPGNNRRGGQDLAIPGSDHGGGDQVDLVAGSLGTQGPDDAYDRDHRQPAEKQAEGDDVALRVGLPDARDDRGEEVAEGKENEQFHLSFFWLSAEAMIASVYEHTMPDGHFGRLPRHANRLLVSANRHSARHEAFLSLSHLRARPSRKTTQHGINETIERHIKRWQHSERLSVSPSRPRRPARLRSSELSNTEIVSTT